LVADRIPEKKVKVLQDRYTVLDGARVVIVQKPLLPKLRIDIKATAQCFQKVFKDDGILRFLEVISERSHEAFLEATLLEQEMKGLVSSFLPDL
jgi:hypothetical protein